MGVPKFYRWLSERYPCLSEVITDAQIPEFDNLYLDMNGIIHNCSHPNDDDITFRISEEQIFLDIFKYIENLFNIIKPQKVFFMAVDGVAPRAKMNQQRARRFMSAKNAEDLLEKAKRAGEEIPSEKRFDSNCITPGTQFMVELNRRLGEWVQHKVNTDGRWRGMRIFLSGHDCPGEGEHKIMDFIRSERATEGYDPNTRHCMYGLDADLIMLGMCSHEPHFSLLREEVKFNRPSKPGSKKKAPLKKPEADSICFHLLHLSILREYLAWEFIKVKDSISFDYDMERIIDDWVLMGFLIGNDFIPHLPNVHIHDDALPLLYKTYMEVLPTLDGYINENGHLNLKRFQEFLRAFSRNDRNSFLQAMEDEEYLATKMGATGIDDDVEGTLVRFEDSDMSSSDLEEEEGEEGRKEKGDAEAAFKSSDEEDEPTSSSRGGPSHGVLADGGIQGAAELLAQLNDDPMEDEFSEQLAALQFREMSDEEFENNVDNCWTRTINNEFKRHKKRYYSDKLKMGNISKGQLREQAEGYVRAIQWNLHYYYHGCCSWNWFFRHHYAPYISDVLDFTTMEMGFEMSQPFLPFEQLMAVLPAASSDCIPRPLRDLMCNAESTIADFYPTEFKTDLNGKKNDWEAVVLIPFIQEKRLLEAIHEKEVLLSGEDRARNVHGPHLMFTSRKQPLNGDWCIRNIVEKDTFRIPIEKVVHGLLPNVKMDVFFPGFPTMKHLPHSGLLTDCHVKVFNMASRKPSMLLTILDRPDLNREVASVAADLLGEEVCIEWPVLKVGLVEEIWTDSMCFKRSYDKNREARKGEVISEKLDEEQKKEFTQWRRDSKDRLMERYAIEPGNVKVMARVRRLLGTSMVMEGDKIVPRRQWTPSDIAVAVPLQLVCVGVLVNENISRVPLSVKEAFPVESKVFVMDPSWSGYGYPGIVKEIVDEETPNCRVTVQYALPAEPMNLRALRSEPERFSLQWCDGYSTQRQTGLDKNLIARLTGTVFLMDCTQEEQTADGAFRPPRLNIGLDLKLSKRNEETPDYAKRQPEGYWIYSILTVRALAEYKNRFPEIFRYLQKSNSIDDNYYSGDIWPAKEKRTERMAELREWLEGLPSHSEVKQKGGEEYADRMAVAHIESVLASMKKNLVFRKSIVRPCMIYRPALNSSSSKVRPDPDASFLLYDRVTFAVEGQNVPFGLTGTIIGKHGDDHVDVLFDSEFPTATKIRSSSSSGSRVLVSSLVNITYAKERKTGGIVPVSVPARKKETTAAPPAKNAWEDRSGKNGDEKKGKEKEKEKRDRKESGGAKGSQKDGPPVTVVKLLKNAHATKTAAGIAVNDNQKRSKAVKTAEAQQLIDMLTGASPGGKNKAPHTPKQKEAKKWKDKGEGEMKTDDEGDEERSKKKGKELLASLMSTSDSKMSERSEKSERKSESSVVTGSTPSTSREEKGPNRKERRAMEREKLRMPQSDKTPKKMNTELRVIPKTPPINNDMFALLGISLPDAIPVNEEKEDKKEEKREGTKEEEKREEKKEEDKKGEAVVEKEDKTEIELPEDAASSTPLQQQDVQQEQQSHSSPRGGRAQNQFWGPTRNQKGGGGGGQSQHKQQYKQQHHVQHQQHNQQHVQHNQQHPHHRQQHPQHHSGPPQMGGYGRPGLPPMAMMNGRGGYGGGPPAGLPPMPMLPSPEAIMMAAAHQMQTQGRPMHGQHMQMQPMQHVQQMNHRAPPHNHHQQPQEFRRGGRGGGGRGGRGPMQPEEYVRDKVTDLTPASVRGFGRGRGTKRGGRGGGGGQRQTHSAPSTAPETGSNSNGQSAPDTNEPQPQPSTAAAATSAAQPKARKPRIVMKLNAQQQE